MQCTAWTSVFDCQRSSQKDYLVGCKPPASLLRRSSLLLTTMANILQLWELLTTLNKEVGGKFTACIAAFMLQRYKIISANDAIPGIKCSRTRARPPCSSLTCIELQVVPYARAQPCTLNSSKVLWLAEGVHIGVRDKPVNA